jgi:hypothetical protein
VLCNGKTLAFQARDAGSIPATRSTVPKSDDRTREILHLRGFAARGSIPATRSTVPKSDDRTREILPNDALASATVWH